MEFLTFYITLLHTDWFRQVYFKQINFWWKGSMRSNITHLIHWSGIIRLHFSSPHLAFYGSDLFKSKKSTFHIFVFWLFWKLGSVFWPVQRCRPKSRVMKSKCVYVSVLIQYWFFSSVPVSVLKPRFLQFHGTGSVISVLVLLLDIRFSVLDFQGVICICLILVVVRSISVPVWLQMEPNALVLEPKLTGT